MAQSGISLSNDPALKSMVDNRLQGDVQVLKRSSSLWKIGSKIVFVCEGNCMHNSASASEANTRTPECKQSLEQVRGSNNSL